MGCSVRDGIGTMAMARSQVHFYKAIFVEEE
jgi:hypothetical protein